MCTDLVPVKGCPDCSETSLVTLAWIEEPLLRGGGYGAARVTCVRVCPSCGWEMTAEISELRPQRRVKAGVRVGQLTGKSRVGSEVRSRRPAAANS